GYAMDTVMGLPSFSYGAGLNLYNNGIPAFFMNRLGAYRVDRRKKNPIYLETLKGMSNIAIQRGVNSLFFPGGTRSRSGMLETELKKGLLGTVVEAQRSISLTNSDKKVFIVPLVISYHFVLEAKFMIDQYLKQTGKEQYFNTPNEPFSIRKLFKFMWEFFSESSEIILSFGQPVDVLGNLVDAEGNSFDKSGNLINIKEYFMLNGVVKQNLQRENEYTNILSDKIVQRYRKENIVLSSHVVAFAMFSIIKNINTDLTIYEVLRLPIDDYVFPIETAIDVVDFIKVELKRLESKDEIKLSKIFEEPTEELIHTGIKKLGKFHAQKPLRFNKNNDIVSDDATLLYYYHNRLLGYGIEDKLQSFFKNYKKTNILLEATP
ncbi:MAG: 1-acyl-sn-glycerol-3-phosphate acyltransferase, partial [Saprospiraceae bacterium]